MRLLTVPQPMAAVLTAPGLHGKPVVNRRFTASYTGPVVLVAGDVNRAALHDPLVASTLTDSGLDLDQLPGRGRALAVAILLDCHLAAGACCAPWGNTSPSWWHLVLHEIRPLVRQPLLQARPALTALSGKEYAEVLTSLV